MLVLTTALACLCAGPVPPPEANKGRSHHAAAAHDSIGIPPAATKTGCAEFDVRLGAQGVTVAPIAGACGPVQLAIVGTPAFDTARRIVELPVALHNTEILQLHPPAAVLARPGSLAITAGTPSGGALRYAAVDSISGDSLRVGRADARWVFDQSLGAPPAPPVVASDGAIVVAPGGMSGPRMVGVAVPRAVTAFRVTLYGSGTNVFTVPVAAPDQVPLEELEDSRAPDNIVTNDPRIPAGSSETNSGFCFATVRRPSSARRPLIWCRASWSGGGESGRVRITTFAFRRIPTAGADRSRR